MWSSAVRQRGQLESRIRRGRRILLVLAVLAGVIAVGAVEQGAQAIGCSTASLLGDVTGVRSIEASAEQDFMTLLNDLRISRSKPVLAWNGAAQGPAAAWSATMSTQIPPGGSVPGWLHHARDKGAGDGVEPSQDYVTIMGKIVPNWRRVAENVGYSGMRSACSLAELRRSAASTVQTLHNAFVASQGHYANMIGEANQATVGVEIDSDQMWVTVRFALGDAPKATTIPVGIKGGAFIDKAHREFLGRAASGSERARWAGALTAADRLAVTQSLAVSDAWAGSRVDDMYRTVLGRSADASGRAYWVSQIAKGTQLESVATLFFASPEYFSRAGGTRERFVRKLYTDLLGRTADSGGVAYWVGLMNGGLDATGVASNFYASIESRRDRARDVWVAILGGNPSGAALESWANRVGVVGDVRLAAEMAASRAFWDAVVVS